MSIYDKCIKSIKLASNGSCYADLKWFRFLEWRAFFVFFGGFLAKKGGGGVKVRRLSSGRHVSLGKNGDRNGPSICNLKIVCVNYGLLR